MKAMQTLLWGAGLLLVGVILWAVVGGAVWTVIKGAVTLIVLLVGILFVVMGAIQVNEDRENQRKEAEETAATEAMAAKA